MTSGGWVPVVDALSLSPGVPVRVRAEAGVAAGLTLSVVEVLPGSRVRLDFHGLIIAASSLLVEGASAPRHSFSGNHRLVLAALSAAGMSGLTDFELESRTGRKQTSFGVRRGELVKWGYVEWSGSKRPSDTNTPSKVWRLTSAGRALVESLQARGAA